MRGIDEFQKVEDVQVTQQEDPSSQRKRTRSEGTSKGAQSLDNEPPWVGTLFDRMTVLESNFNNHFDRIDDQITPLKHDVHYLYER